MSVSTCRRPWTFSEHVPARLKPTSVLPNHLSDARRCPALTTVCLVVQDSIFWNVGEGSCPAPMQPQACDGCVHTWRAEAFQFQDDRHPWALWTPQSTMHTKVRRSSLVCCPASCSLPDCFVAHTLYLQDHPHCRCRMLQQCLRYAWLGMATSPHAEQTVERLRC